MSTKWPKVKKDFNAGIYIGGSLWLGTSSASLPTATTSTNVQTVQQHQQSSQITLPLTQKKTADGLMMRSAMGLRGPTEIRRKNNDIASNQLDEGAVPWRSSSCMIANNENDARAI
jgi:hypothetical protein